MSSFHVEKTTHFPIDPIYFEMFMSLVNYEFSSINEQMSFWVVVKTWTDHRNIEKQ